MALEGFADKKKASAHAEAFQASNQQADQSQQNNTWSFSSFASINPLQPGLGGEVVTKMTEALRKTFEGLNSDFEVTILPVDRTVETQLDYSAVVICLRSKRMPEVGTAFYTFVLEGSNDPVTPYVTNVNGEQVSVTRVTSDAINAVLLNIVAKKVQSAFPGSKYLNADANVIPREFNVEDEQAVRIEAANAARACSTMLNQSVPGFTDMNLAQNARDTTLVVSPKFSHQQTTDDNGAPVRSDVIIDFMSQSAAQQNNPQYMLNNGNMTKIIARQSGYIDELWCPRADTSNPYMQMATNAGQVPTQKFAGRYVITNINNEVLNTLTGVLFALLPANVLAENNNWYRTYASTPNTSMSSMNTHDVGVLNIEANLHKEPNMFGSYIDLNKDNVTPGDLGAYLNAVFNPGLLIGMDCPFGGPQSWYTSVFADACAGNSRASAAIIAAAMTLTNGNFKKYFQDGTNVFANAGELIHTGYFIGKDDLKHDIRDIDYLLIGKVAGKENPMILREWTDTFNNTAIRIEKRLQTRENIMRQVAGNMQIKGKALRVTFNGAFLIALSMGCKDAGLTVSTNLSWNGDMMNQRGVAAYAQTAALGTGVSGIFTGFNSNQNAGGGNIFTGSTRWSAGTTF